MSPEVLNKGEGYDFKSDIWSLGCLLYELAMLKSPFKAEGLNLYSLFQKISNGDYVPLPDNFSEELRNLTTGMLSTNPEDRPEISEVARIAQEMRTLTSDKSSKSRKGSKGAIVAATSTTAATTTATASSEGATGSRPNSGANKNTANNGNSNNSNNHTSNHYGGPAAAGVQSSDTPNPYRTTTVSHDAILASNSQATATTANPNNSSTTAGLTNNNTGGSGSAGRPSSTRASAAPVTVTPTALLREGSFKLDAVYGDEDNDEEVPDAKPSSSSRPSSHTRIR